MQTKILSTIIVFSMLAFTVQSAVPVSGKITEGATGNPLEFANIVLLSLGFVVSCNFRYQSDAQEANYEILRTFAYIKINKMPTAKKTGIIPTLVALMLPQWLTT